MSTICSTGCRGTTGTTSVGTSTNCSAICVAERTAQRGRDGHKIVGTSITCWGLRCRAAQVHRESAPASEVGKLLHGVFFVLVLVVEAQ